MPRSLSRHARQLTRELSFRACVAAIILFGTAFGFFVYSWDKKVISMFADQKTNIEYWFQVGDSFQLQRFLSGLVTIGAIQSAQIVEGSSGHAQSIVQVGQPGPRPLVSWSRGLSFELHDQTGQPVARLNVRYPVAIWPIFASVLLLAFSIILFRISVDRSLQNLTQEIVAPVERLVGQLESMGSTSQLIRMPMPNHRVQEIEYLASTLVKMAKRIEGVEQQKRILEQQSLLVSISRQVAHDIRSPLSALRIIAQKAKGLSESERVLTEKATAQISQIADDLLKKTRDETKTVAVSGPPFDCLELFKEVAELKQIEWHASRPVNFSLRGEDGIRVVVSRPDLGRILSNLINNSIEASPQGGTIEMSVSENAGEITIAVVDDGLGIPETLLHKIIDEGLTVGKSCGNALGLPWARQKLKEWGGALEIASTVGKGTKIQLKIPSEQKVPDTV